MSAWYARSALEPLQRFQKLPTQVLTFHAQCKESAMKLVLRELEAVEKYFQD
jgi:hypothetical protein